MTIPEHALTHLYAEHLSVLKQRFSSALEATGFERAVIFAGELRTEPRDDNTYPFRVEPYFAAWLPFVAAPGSAICFEPDVKLKLVYRQDEDFWYLPPDDPDGFWTEHFEIAVTHSGWETAHELRDWRAQTAAIGPLPGAAELHSRRRDDRFAAVNHTGLLARLDYDRARKTPFEVACMSEASLIAARGHRAVALAFDAGVSEFELNQIYCSATGQREPELPYSSVVALNEHAAVLHYQRLDREPPAECRSFLIDAGAQYLGYAADVTRTWQRAANGFGELIEAMNGLQQTLCDEVATGVDFVALNERTHRLLAELLRAHSVIRCSAEEAFDTGLTRVFLPHGLGHLLGLQVHDAGGWQSSPEGATRKPPEEHPFLRLTRELEAGFVFTIEPGLYFIDSLLDKLDGGQRARLNMNEIAALKPYGGIRIEDNLVVESTRSRNLTREAFSAFDER